jgi:hypothetical protein
MPAVLFAWRRCVPPFLVGGAEVSQQLLAEEFVSAGWQVTYLGSHETPWNGVSELDVMRRQLALWGVHHIYAEARGELRYSWKGVDCRSVPQAGMFSTLNAVLRAGSPELVVTSQEGSAVLAKQATTLAPVAGWIHSVSRTGMEVLRGGPQYALATSRFVVSRMPASTSTRTILFYPPFAAAAVDPPVASDRAGDLLMVNPVPAKGARLVKDLAYYLPQRRFTLVEGWWDTSARFTGLANVRYVKRTYEMDSLYADHRVLLVPSVVDDAFPRVIIEAGLAGLPTIGSDRGGIAEAIEDGGLVVATAEVAAWASAITSLDGPAWEDRARRARERSSRLVRGCLTELAAAGVIAAT